MKMEHPIGSLMTTAMQNIKEMIDVNTIVGDAVQTQEGTVIIPISRVSFGFAAGGGEYSTGKSANKQATALKEENSPQAIHPFAGGSGAGISIQPVAFLVVAKEEMKLMPVNVNTSLEKILDSLPEMMQKFNFTSKNKTFASRSMGSSISYPLQEEME